MNPARNYEENRPEPQQPTLSKAEMTALFLEAVKRFSKEYGDDLYVHLSIRFQSDRDFEVSVWQYIANKYSGHVSFQFHDFETISEAKERLDQLDVKLALGDFEGIQELSLQEMGL